MAESTRPDSIDPLFTQPYVDVDEWRDVPVRHRYVDGGFAGTDTRFSMYLPPAARYEGQFFQHITPVPDSEHLAQEATGEQDKIGCLGRLRPRRISPGRVVAHRDGNPTSPFARLQDLARVQWSSLTRRWADGQGSRESW